jgi:hypothetical protein
VLFAVPLVAALLVLPATPASADDPHANLDCTFVTTQDINPPITPEFRTHASTTGGLTGTANCTGTIDSAQVTGTGSIGVNAVAESDCTTGTAMGTFVLQVPTTEGIKTVTGQFESTFGPVPGGGITVTGDLSGTVTTLSVVGDCVNTPVSQSTTRWNVHVST